MTGSAAIRKRFLVLVALLGAVSLWDTTPQQARGADQDRVIVIAGDIAPAGGLGASAATAKLARAQNPDRILIPGDLVHGTATLGEYERTYDKTWGQLDDVALLRPVPGNHDYSVANASGYRTYTSNLGGDDLSYAANVGTWRIYALNSECSKINCASLAAWLDRDLKAYPKRCVLAYWHRPLRSTGPAPTTTVRPFWTALYKNRADVVANSHAHVWEEWPRLTDLGTADPANGVKQFTVGTGGAPLHSFVRTDSRILHRAAKHGILRLDLHATSYHFKFIGVDGTTIRQGYRECTR
jgi:hypothetical protein